jgi:hypothetical protein
MSDLPTLKAHLKRGALVTAANWPVVLLQFVAESTFKLLVAVPVVCGAMLVALAVGRDLGELLSGDLRDAVTTVAEGLFTHPGAFAGFVVGLLAALGGGAIVTFLVKGGTVTVLALGEQRAGPIEQPPLELDRLRAASGFSVALFLDGAGRLFRRYLRLGLLLGGVYAASGGLYLVAAFGGYALVAGTPLVVGWTVLAAIGSSALVVWITMVNLAYLLVQMVVAIEDCSVRQAWRTVVRFARSRGADVALVFAVVFGLVLVATAASLVAAAGLGLVSFVPFVGLAVLPLQVAGWLLRGLVFQYLGLTALGAYLGLYRGRPVADRIAVVRSS